MLAKVQPAILQNEAALDTLSAEIRSHDVHLRECDGIGVGSHRDSSGLRTVLFVKPTR